MEKGFYSPFDLSVDRMSQLILINFESDLDVHYNVFELQQAYNEDSGGRLVCLVAYRKDGGSDIYFQKDYPLASQSSILNEVSFFETDFEYVKFDFDNDTLDVGFIFEDRYGRKIEVSINEHNRAKKRPIFLLAPVGVVSKKPKSLPVYSLHNFTFTRIKYSKITIMIGGREHKPDKFPLPLDLSRNYMTRYSTDTFNVDLNKAFDGELLPINPGPDNRALVNGVSYTLRKTEDQYQIKALSTSNMQHKTSVNFSPPFSDVMSLGEKTNAEGSFSIVTDGSGGGVVGEYKVQRINDEVVVTMHPCRGWIPNDSRVIIKIMFWIVRVFKSWPKSYLWEAKIKTTPTGNPTMTSAWKRI
jgi:hypothetical protein